MERFTYGSKTYQVTEVQHFDPSLTAIIAEAQRNNKVPAFYMAVEVLRSGRLSARGAAFYKSTVTGGFVKV